MMVWLNLTPILLKQQKSELNKCLSHHDYAMAAQLQHCIMAVLDAISHFHPEICKTRQIYIYIYIDVGLFISRCFFVLRHHFAPRHFYPEVGQKNSESRRKKRNLAKNCSKHFSALDNMARPCKTIQNLYRFIRLGFFQAFMLGIERKNAYRLVRYFFLPSGVCRYVSCDSSDWHLWHGTFRINFAPLK